MNIYIELNMEMKGMYYNTCSMKKEFTGLDFPEDGLKADDKAAKAEAL